MRCFATLLLITTLCAACATGVPGHRHGAPVVSVSGRAADASVAGADATGSSSEDQVGMGAVAAGGAVDSVRVQTTRPVADVPGAEGKHRPLPPNPYVTHRKAVPAEAQHRFDRAVAAVDADDWQGAYRELRELTQRYPRFSGPMLDLALVQEHLGVVDEAEQWYRRAIAANDSNIDAYNQLGILLRRRGRFAEAEKVYLQALAVWEPAAQVHLNIAVLYDLYLGDAAKALAHYQRYQTLTDGTDRTVAGWIADLERRQLSVTSGGGV